MQVGQKVVCIDASIPTPVAKYFTSLPVKGQTYTIRAVYLARRVLHPSGPGAADGDVGLLLQELRNPPDPRNKHGQELGFSSDRFRPLEKLPDEADEETAEDREFIHNVLEHVSDPVKVGAFAWPLTPEKYDSYAPSSLYRWSV